MFDKVLSTPLHLNVHTVVNALEVCLKILQYKTNLAFKFEELNNFNVPIIASFVFLKSLNFLLQPFPIILYFDRTLSIVNLR